LGYSGLKLDEELEIFDVPIKYHGNQFIHTIRCGDKAKPPLVMLHGYGGSLALYYRMLKELSQNYNVYAIDFLGLGLSSKLSVPFDDGE